MKSFEPFYAILAAYIPVSVLTAFMFPAALILGRFTGRLPLAHWFAAGALSAVIASIYWALVKKSKTEHAQANIRGAILMVIVMYGLASLLHFERSLGTRFLPSFYNIPSALAALAIWFPMVAIKRIFGGQEFFESHIREFEGEKLRQIMLEDSSVMSEADGNLKKLSNYYGLFFLPPLALLCIAGGMGIRFSAALAGGLLVLFTLGVSIIAFLYFLRREYAYAAEGLNLRGRSGTVAAAILVIAGAAGFGILLSSDKSLFPPSLIADLLRRLLAFFERPARAPAKLPPPPLPEATQNQDMGLPRELLELMGDVEPSRFWDYVKYAALAGAALLFLWFMLKPLLGRSRLFRGIQRLPKKTAAFLGMWLKTLVEGAFYFFRSLREGTGGKKITQPPGAALRTFAEDILKAYSAAKRRELRQSIGLFARLIYWGQEVLKVDWKPSHAPAEYCGLLAAAAGDSPGHNSTAILRAGALFEKALYSASPLSRTEQNEFKTLAEKITASP